MAVLICVVDVSVEVGVVDVLEIVDDDFDVDVTVNDFVVRVEDDVFVVGLAVLTVEVLTVSVNTVDVDCGNTHISQPFRFPE